MQPLRWDIRQLFSMGSLVLVGVLLVLFQYPDRGFGFKPMPAEAEGVERRTYSLVEASRAIGILRENYAFQSRLAPTRMLLAALQSVEEEFDYVLVSPSVDLSESRVLNGEPLPTSITIQIRDQKGSFDLAKVGDLYQMTWKLMEIFEFFSPDDEEAQRMEDAAVEGLLTVLDPHTTYMSEREYKDMRLSTRGSFGGLGIVIAVREGKLQVVSVMDGTPAARAGLEKGDHILRIGQESTENMTVSEAANRLRGKPGTDIKIWIQREGRTGSRPVSVTREVIRVQSVLAQDLDGRTAYVRVKGFQTNTAKEVKAFLDKTYPTAPPTGIILDLRGNSGGVMSAAVELADLFLSDGTVVTTVEKVRTGTETEPSRSGDRYENAALVVLVDHASASASEIVTGALKYRERAVVIGSRTFGKGSVQYINPLQRGALKLTVAQYVGPNMEVIQGSGIEPHIELRRIFARDGLHLPSFAAGFEGEGALPYRLENTGAVPVADMPLYHIRYVPEEGERDALEEYDSVHVDFPVRLAWSMIAWYPHSEAPRMLAHSKELLEDIARYEEDLIGEFAPVEGKSWEWVPMPETPRLDLELAVAPERLEAGEEGVLTVTVTNTGTAPLPRLEALTESTNYRFDDRNCLLGTIQAGETVTCDIKFEMPATSPRRKDRVYVDVVTDLEPPLRSASVTVETMRSPLPRIALDYSVDDDTGNGDNRIQVGEEVTIVARITNVGDGTLAKGLATVKNLSNAALFLRKGRVDIEDLQPGETRTVRFEVTAQEAPEDGVWAFELGVIDMDARTHFYATQRLDVPGASEPVRRITHFLQSRQESTPIHIAPHGQALVFGYLHNDGGVQAVARQGKWLKLQLPQDRWGWVRARDLEASVRSELATFRTVHPIVQPTVTLTRIEPDELLGDADHVTLRGAVDFGEGKTPAEAGIAVYRNGQKVAMDYLGTVGAGDRVAEFELTVDLEPGVNRFLLSAFQKNQSPGYTSIYYNRLE